MSGTIATIFAIEGHMTNAALFVFLGIFFDFFDGFFARKLNANSDFGLKLDSLADMVTSGLVPALVLFHLLELAIAPSWDTYQILPYFAVVALASPTD